MDMMESTYKAGHNKYVEKMNILLEYMETKLNGMEENGQGGMDQYMKLDTIKGLVSMIVFTTENIEKNPLRLKPEHLRLLQSIIIESDKEAVKESIVYVAKDWKEDKPCHLMRYQPISWIKLLRKINDTVFQLSEMNAQRNAYAMLGDYIRTTIDNNNPFTFEESAYIAETYREVARNGYGSCMTQSEYKYEFLDFYDMNNEVVTVIKILDQHGNAVGRALKWKVMAANLEGVIEKAADWDEVYPELKWEERTFIDRVYPNNSLQAAFLKKWAKENDYLTIELDTFNQPIIDKNGSKYAVRTDYMENADESGYPYCDTIDLGAYARGSGKRYVILTNKHFVLKNEHVTKGMQTYSLCEDNGQVFGYGGGEPEYGMCEHCGSEENDPEEMREVVYAVDDNGTTHTESWCESCWMDDAISCDIDDKTYHKDLCIKDNYMGHMVPKQFMTQCESDRKWYLTLDCVETNEETWVFKHNAVKVWRLSNYAVEFDNCENMQIEDGKSYQWVDKDELVQNEVIKLDPKSPYAFNSTYTEYYMMCDLIQMVTEMNRKVAEKIGDWGEWNDNQGWYVSTHEDLGFMQLFYDLLRGAYETENGLITGYVEDDDDMVNRLSIEEAYDIAKTMMSTDGFIVCTRNNWAIFDYLPKIKYYEETEMNIHEALLDPKWCDGKYAKGWMIKYENDAVCDLKMRDRYINALERQGIEWETE